MKLIQGNIYSLKNSYYFYNINDDQKTILRNGIQLKKYDNILFLKELGILFLRQFSNEYSVAMVYVLKANKISYLLLNKYDALDNRQISNIFEPVAC